MHSSTIGHFQIVPNPAHKPNLYTGYHGLCGTFRSKINVIVYLQIHSPTPATALSITHTTILRAFGRTNTIYEHEWNLWRAGSVVSEHEMDACDYYVQYVVNPAPAHAPRGRRELDRSTQAMLNSRYVTSSLLRAEKPSLFPLLDTSNAPSVLGPGVHLFYIELPIPDSLPGSMCLPGMHINHTLTCTLHSPCAPFPFSLFRSSWTHQTKTQLLLPRFNTLKTYLCAETPVHTRTVPECILSMDVSIPHCVYVADTYIPVTLRVAVPDHEILRLKIQITLRQTVTVTQWTILKSQDGEYSEIKSRDNDHDDAGDCTTKTSTADLVLMTQTDTTRADNGGIRKLFVHIPPSSSCPKKTLLPIRANVLMYPSTNLTFLGLPAHTPTRSIITHLNSLKMRFLQPRKPKPKKKKRDDWFDPEYIPMNPTSRPPMNAGFRRRCSHDFATGSTSMPRRDDKPALFFGTDPADLKKNSGPPCPAYCEIDLPPPMSLTHAAESTNLFQHKCQMSVCHELVVQAWVDDTHEIVVIPILINEGDHATRSDVLRHVCS